MRETLNEIRRASVPVPRSCHIGNNTSNVWAWLKLAGNTRVVQYDHTLYGVDENCIPWAILDDGGIIRIAFDYRGCELTDAAGLHVNQHLPQISRSHKSHLNYAIHALVDSQDLMAHQVDLASALSTTFAGAAAQLTTDEVVEIWPRLLAIFQRLTERRALSQVFDRWISTSRRGQVVMEPIGELRYVDSDGIEVRSNVGRRLYAGSAENFLERYLAAAKAVSSRLRDGTHRDVADYPWHNLHFTYALGALHEYCVSEAGGVFWHAGGSASQYYTNDPQFAQQMDSVIEMLIECKALPPQTRIWLVPTFCCQLFASTTQSLSILADLLATWRTYWQRRRELWETMLVQAAGARDPACVLSSIAAAVEDSCRVQLVGCLRRFNAADNNRLPIAHIARMRHPTYNKYGICQGTLGVGPILFPDDFDSFRWSELELLVKYLSWLVIDERG